jgi:hypothetical protein
MGIKCEGEIRSLTLSELHTLAMLEKRVVRKMFGTMWKEVTVGWRKLYNL